MNEEDYQAAMNRARMKRDEGSMEMRNSPSKDPSYGDRNDVDFSLKSKKSNDESNMPSLKGGTEPDKTSAEMI